MIARYVLTVFLALFFGAITWLAYAYVDDRTRRMWRTGTHRMARHARRIRTLEDRVQALADHAGLTFVEEETEADTVEIPVVTEPEEPTVEMHAAFNAAAAELVETEWREVNIGGTLRRFPAVKRSGKVEA